ncbi:MAG: elongation factor 1-beta [archaeon]
MPPFSASRKEREENKGFPRMGITLIKIKIMPTSPEVDLKEIKKEAQKIIEENKGMRVMFEEQPIAFGLKAVIAGFDIDESDELEPIENSLREIENVSSAEVVDMRRAFG